MSDVLVKLLSDLRTAQSDLLNLKREKAGKQLDSVFSAIIDYCRENEKKYNSLDRSSVEFLLRKQLKLIRTTTQKLIYQTHTIADADDKTIICYFEEQIRLKKIINKHLETLQQ